MNKFLLASLLETFGCIINLIDQVRDLSKLIGKHRRVASAHVCSGGGRRCG